MQNELRVEIGSLVGLECSKATMSYVGHLNVLLGELEEKSHPGRKNTFYGEYEILTWSASWRILRGEQIAAGFYDDDSSIQAVLDSLLGAKVSEVHFGTTVADVRFVFDNDMTVEILGVSGEEYSWELKTPSGYIEAHPSNLLVKKNSDYVEELDPVEKALAIHAESCSQRWESLIPSESKEHCCSDCIYYRRLEAEFHFGDYGLCSNVESPFDGKVVRMRSSCDQYVDEFK